MGLGDISVHSSLNQPFDAEIELLDVGDTPLSLIKVNLASAEDFERLNLERAYALDLLVFTVDKTATGKPIIKVRSIERMDEPYLQMLVDLGWVNGQVYRAYTILLDPPEYQLTRVKKQTSNHAVKESAGDERANSSQINAESQVVEEQRGEASYGPTMANETIWQVAQRYKTSDVILQQVILAILGTNTEAFVDGNLNGMKVGSSLKIPDSATIRSVPAEKARLEVLAQDTAWREKQPIKHVLAPPYTIEPLVADDEMISQLPAVPVLSKSISVTDAPIPSLLPKLSSLLTAGDDTAPAATGAKTTDQQVIAKQMKAEIDIATTAIESVRETNTVLNDQLRLLQEMNKRLQQQLTKRQQEIKQLQQQILLISKRQGLAGQASGVAPESDTGNVFLWLLLFMLAAAGGGYAYWRFWRLTETEQAVAQAITETNIIIPPQPIEERVVEESQTVAPVVLEVEEPNAVVPEHQEELPVVEPAKFTEELIPEVVVEMPSETNERLDFQLEPEVPPATEVELKEEMAEEGHEAVIESTDDHVLEFELGEDLSVTSIHKEETPLLTEEKEETDEHGLDYVPATTTPSTAVEQPVKSKRALTTLLDLAKTYQSMGDIESAKQSLQEVLVHGDEAQQQEAKQLLDKLDNQ